MQPEGGLKQSHGGGDDIEEENTEKRVKLEKYLNTSDFNLTDLFERIVKAYKNNEDVKKILEKIKHDRMSLLRAGIRSMQNGMPHLKITKSTIAEYLIRMTFDKDWKDVFKHLIVETYNRKTKHPLHLIIGMNKIFKKKEIIFSSWISEFLLDIDNEEFISLINEMHNDRLTEKLKKHLMLIAKDDVKNNKKNAIGSLVDIVEKDAEVLKFFIFIFRKRDDEGHKFILEYLVLKKKIENEELLEEIKNLQSKTDNPHLKNLIKRIMN